MATDLHTRMRLFTRVVEAASFTGAAQHLGVAPTSVSRQVAALEDDLGARLLNRTTRRQRLTDAGALYYESAKRILADIDDANLGSLALRGDTTRKPTHYRAGDARPAAPHADNTGVSRALSRNRDLARTHG